MKQRVQFEVPRVWGTGNARRREWVRRKYGHKAWKPPGERFWDHVEVTDTCWNWIGARNSSGYGRFMGNGRAHRFAYELIVGDIPNGLTLDHLCRNRQCVNPDHLEPVSNAENVMRGGGFAPKNAAKTHCPKGHPLVEGNIRYRKEGRWRSCLTCERSR